MSYFDDASLVFIPSGYKTSKAYSIKPTDGTGDLTFTRSNDTATRVNSAGLIEKVRTNLLLHSNTFTNAAWVKDGCTITAAYGTAPDGTQTASRAVFSGADKTIYQLISATGVAGSLYVKGTAGQTIAFGIAGSESTFTLDGTWQRFTKSIAGSTSSIQLNTYGGVTARDVLIWSAQLEYGDIATDVIPTTSAAVSVGPVANVPRLDYLNSSCPRLLLEPQRTNLSTFSEQFNNTVWFKETGNSVTANTIASPDGYTNADTTTATSTNAINVNQSHTSASSSVHTFSIFLKKNNLSEIQVYIFSAGFLARAGVNLDNGTITDINGSGATITNYGNGWYRCSVQATINTGVGFTIGYLSASTTGSRSVYTYGAQLEVGAYATSYIPTLGAAVTRGADYCLKSGINSLIGDNFTLFFQGRSKTAQDGGITRYIASKGSGALYNNFVTIEQNGSNLEVVVQDSSFVQVFFASTPLALNTNFKVALRVKSGSIAFYLNGTQVSVSSSTFTINADTLYLGYYVDGGVVNSAASQAIVLPSTMTNAQLAELTTL